MFFDFQNNSISGLQFYSTILIDDIDFGKIGSGWYGNQTLMSFGVFSSQLYKFLPVDIELKYLKIDPYVFTHRISDHNFTNSNYSLGTDIPPNSSSGIFNIFYRPHHRINIQLGYTYSVHGENLIDENGYTINFGGDINLGHRIGDSENVRLLNGEKEVFRKVSFSTQIEPVKNWQFSINVNYLNNSLAGSHHFENFFTSFSLYTKI